MIIRPETQEDIEAIENVTKAAFSGKSYSDQTEHLILNRLRTATVLTHSLVAVTDEKVVGHVAFSRVTINGEDKGWLGLGPISVLPDSQKQGVGSQLINAGLALIREKGARGCVLEGSPAYYNRFGFQSYPQLFYEGAPAPEYFMALPFYDELPSGKVEFHTAFYGKA